MSVAHRKCRCFGATSIFRVPPRSYASAIATVAAMQRRQTTIARIGNGASRAHRCGTLIRRPWRIVRAIVLTPVQFFSAVLWRRHFLHRSSLCRGSTGGLPPPPTAICPPRTAATILPPDAATPAAAILRLARRLPPRSIVSAAFLLASFA